MRERCFRRLLPAALLLMFCLAGCGGDDTAASATAPSEVSSAPASSSAAPGGSSAVVSVPSAPLPPAIEIPLGQFFHFDDTRYTEDRAPYFNLLGGGAAEFYINTGLESMGMAHGSYTLQGSTLTLFIEAVEVDTAFLGDSYPSLSFAVVDTDHLEYLGDTFGLTRGGDVFARVGAPNISLPPATETPVASSSPIGSSSVAPSSSSAPAPQSESTPVSSSVSSYPSADGAAVPAAEGPPESVQVGDMFEITGVDLESVLYDAELLSLEVGGDGDSIYLTALAPGTASISYAPLGGEGQAYSIKIADTDTGGFPLYLVLAVAGGSILVGSGLTFLLLTLLGRTSGKRKKKNRKREGKEESKPVLAAQKRVRAAEKEAAKKSRQAEKAQESADKAKQAAEEARQNAEKAQAAVEEARLAPPEEKAKRGRRSRRRGEAVSDADVAAQGEEAPESSGRDDPGSAQILS